MFKVFGKKCTKTSFWQIIWKRLKLQIETKNLFNKHWTNPTFKPQYDCPYTGCALNFLKKYKMFGQLHWKEQFKSVLLKKKTKGTTIGS